MLVMVMVLLLVVGAYVTVPPDQGFCQNFCDSGAGGLEVMVALQKVAELRAV